MFSILLALWHRDESESNAYMQPHPQGMWCVQNPNIKIQTLVLQRTPSGQGAGTEVGHT